jgi:hypothetical protein
MGEWNGALNMGSQLCACASWSPKARPLTLYSVDQGNSAIPVGDHAIEGGPHHARIPVIRGSFTGELRGGRIDGQFTQGGTLPLVFTARRSAAAAPTDALTQARLEALRAGVNFAGHGRSRKPRPVAEAIAFATGLRAIGHASASRLPTNGTWARSPNR